MIHSRGGVLNPKPNTLDTYDLRCFITMDPKRMNSASCNYLDIETVLIHTSLLCLYNCDRSKLNSG